MSDATLQIKEGGGGVEESDGDKDEDGGAILEH